MIPVTKLGHCGTRQCWKLGIKIETNQSIWHNIVDFSLRNMIVNNEMCRITAGGLPQWKFKKTNTNKLWKI